MNCSPSHDLRRRRLCENALMQSMGLVTWWQGAEWACPGCLTLLGHSRVLLRPRSTVSRGKRPEANFLSIGKIKWPDSSGCIARYTSNLYRGGTKIESCLLNSLTFLHAFACSPSRSRGASFVSSPFSQVRMRKCPHLRFFHQVHIQP
jgi:hypothetical protein